MKGNETNNPVRPTAKDLAEAAGVSLATVDRVLNERPNVSRKTTGKVNEAIDRIGFVRNIAAVNLARNKTYNFVFLLPESGDQYLQELLKQIEEASRLLTADLTIVKTVQIPTDDPHRITGYLSSLDQAEVDGVAVMAPESPQVRDAMARLFERGIKVVQFLSGQEKLDNLDFVGVNNVAAGATAGKIIGRFTGQQPGKVVVITETMHALDSIDRRLGFDKTLIEKFPHLRALPSLETYGNEKRAQEIINRTFSYNSDIVAVYVPSSEARVPVSCISRITDLKQLSVVVHERTPFGIDGLQNETIDAIIAQNPGHAVRSAIRILRARTDRREPLASQEKTRIEILLKENL